MGFRSSLRNLLLEAGTIGALIIIIGFLKRGPIVRVTIRVLWYRGVKNYLFYFFFGGVLTISIVSWAPKPSFKYIKAPIVCKIEDVITVVQKRQ